MRNCKKLLSIILAIAMIMTTMSVCFTSFAAGTTEPSNKNMLALVDALKSENVANATYKVSESSTGSGGNKKTTYTVNVDDPTGDIMKMAKAYWAVFNEVVAWETENKDQGEAWYNNFDNRTATQANALIQTKVADKMGADYTNYKSATVLNAMVANRVGTSAIRDGYNSSNSNYPDLTFVINVNLNSNVIINNYANVNDIPDDLESGYSFSFMQQRGNWQTGTIFKTNHYFYLSRKPIETLGSPVDAQSLKDLGAALEKYSDIFGKPSDVILTMDADEVTEAYTEISAAYDSAKASYLSGTISHFFGSVTELEANLDQLASAARIIRYLSYIEAMKNAVDVDYTSMDLSETTALYNDLKSKYDVFTSLDEELKADLVAQTSFDVAQFEDYLAALANHYELVQLESKKVYIEKYKEINIDDIASDDVSGAALSLAIGELQGFKSAVNTYKPENVATVFGTDVAEEINALIDEAVASIEAIMPSVQIKDDVVARYSYFVSTVATAVEIDANSAELLENVKSYDSWYTELKEFVASVKDEVGEETAAKIMNNLDTEMLSRMDAVYATLESRVGAQIKLAYDYLEDIHNIYGDEVKTASLSTYNKCVKALNIVETEIYDYLLNEAPEGTSNYKLSQDIQDMWAALNAFSFEDYLHFKATNGLDEYTQSTIDEIVRATSSNDKVRDKDYTVTDESVEEIIRILDKVLTSDEVKSAGLDINALLASLPEMIYNDGTVNSIVKLLFPMLSDLLIPIWSTLLPETFEIPNEGDGIPDIVKGKSGTLNILPLYDVCKNVGLDLFPTLLAESVRADFPQVADVLAQATTVPDVTGERDEYGDIIYDEEGNFATQIIINPWNDEVLYDEEGNLALEWGVTDKDSFILAVSDIFKFLEPVLVALMSNKTGEIKGHTAGSGQIAKIIASFNLDLNIIQIVARIDEGGNLFNDVLAPIFELLGLEKDQLADGKEFATINDVLYAVFNAVELLLDKIGESPVDFVVSALPNLAYAIESGAIFNLIEQIDIPFTLKFGCPSSVSNSWNIDAGFATGLVTAIAGAIAGGALDEAIGLDMFMDNFPTSLNISELVDFDNLEINGTKLDLTSTSGLINSILGLVAEGLALPKIDGTTLSSLGELVWNDTRRDNKAYSFGEDGKAAHIVANKADVLLFVVQYLLDALSDPSLLENILAATAEEGAEPVVLPAIVNEIIANVSANPTDAIAAIVELVMPQDYTPAPSMQWKEIDKDPEEDSSVEVTYSEDWTKEKAQYVADHLGTFIDDIILLTGIKVNGEEQKTLSSLVDNVITENVYTSDLVNTINDAIAGLIGGIEIPEELNSILKDQIGIDLAAWKDVSVEAFENGDVDAFKAALTEILNPIAPVFRFILADEDITISVSDADGKTKVVTLSGNDGYSNGIVPLLEALGCTNVKTTSAFIADKENIVENLISNIINVVTNISADPYEAVTSIVPNVLYYLDCDGAAVLVDNLLYPINQVLDTIRPIYDVNIEAMLDFDLRAYTNDLIATAIQQLAAYAEENFGLDIDVDYTTDSIYNAVNSGKLVEYTSANGNKAYKLDASEGAADMVTVILRYIASEVLFSDNAPAIADLLDEQFDLAPEQYAFLYAFLTGCSMVPENKIDNALGLLVYMFYGLDLTADAIVIPYYFYTYDWEALYNILSDANVSAGAKVEAAMQAIYKNTFKTIFDKYSHQRLEELLKDIKDHEETPEQKAEKAKSIIKTITEFIIRLQEMFVKIFEQIKAIFSK